MEKIKVFVTWGTSSLDSPVLVFKVSIPSGCGLGQPLELEIVKRQMQRGEKVHCRSQIYLPAMLDISCFTVEMCPSVVQAIHDVQPLMTSIDKRFVPGEAAEIDDLCDEAVATALGTKDFDIEIAKECEDIWERAGVNPYA